jgi:hypothetical protein
MMATPGEFLVNNTSDDCTMLLVRLESVKTLANRIAQRMDALGADVLSGYQWPNEYTQAKFVALYNALNNLPGTVVEDSTRDKIVELVAAIQ